LKKQADFSTFEELYRDYGKKILNLALRMTGDEDDARDLTQEIFIKVYENIDTFEEKSHVYTWIYRIAVNHIFNHLKKIRRTRWLNIMNENIMEALHEDQIDPGYLADSGEKSPDRLLEKHERETIVREMVESLHPKYRVPFLLFRYEELSYEEIATTLNLSLSAVEARIHRAKKQLMEKMKPWLKDL
jgi:RNA polymerase sigma-70 factor, ECF subfamily